VRYDGYFEIPSPGKFSVAVDVGSNPAQAAEIPTGIKVWAPLEINSQLPPKPSEEEEQEPLILFKTARPLIRSYQYGDSICLLQRSAIDLTLQAGSPMRLRLEGIYKKESNFRQPITSSDPSLIAIDQDKILSEKKEELSAIEQDTKGWDLTPSSTKRIALVAHIDDKTGIPPENRELKVTPLVLRWLIEGVDSNGDPVARFYDQDIQVRVASQMELEFLWVWIVFFLGAIAILVIGWFLVHTSRSARTSSTKITLPSMEDDLYSQSRSSPEIDADGDHADSNPADHQPANHETNKKDEGKSAAHAFGMDGSDD
jgi:hypothetical protein